MKHIKYYETHINELNETITLYHGTSIGNAEYIVKNGWFPRTSGSGGNMGQSKYLYITSEIGDARWFANENGDDTIMKISNINIMDLKFDPEDGDADLFDYKISNAIDKLKNGYDMPIKFVLYKPTDKSHFSII